MNTSKLFMICGLVFFGTTAYGSCYHKIGGACKDGYASGYLSDCSTPCTTGVASDKDKHATTSNNAGVAQKKMKKDSKAENTEQKQNDTK